MSVSGCESITLPPLAPEDYVCLACSVDYPSISVPEAVETIRAVAQRARTGIDGVAPAALGRRPEPGVWSIAEYGCHLRDVYVTYTIRLYRARTEECPQVEPMLNDLRARRFKYSERDVSAVLDEVHASAHGFCEEIGRMEPDDWTRVVSRLPGEERTAMWLVRQAMHEGVHHLNDISQVKSAVKIARSHYSLPSVHSLTF